MQAMTYYHVYNRGADRRTVFHDAADYRKFMVLLDRYLSPEVTMSSTAVPYPNFFERINVVSYCLMPNHFHLLVGAVDLLTLGKFMQCLKIAYSRYFNYQNSRKGVLFETAYRARQVVSNFDLINLSRYIHLNPQKTTPDLLTYSYSSLCFYTDNALLPWLDAEPVLSNFRDSTEYLDFVTNAA